jgi:ubiquinone/menaquinone biosynthesis C-methylase UbiE
MEQKDFWKNQAKKFKSDAKAVNFDIDEELEIIFLEDYIIGKGVICDIGCGNGRTTIELAKKNKDSTFYGVDFIKEMIDAANNLKQKQNIKNVFFYQADASSKDLSRLFDFKFDKIITKRLLINLKGKSKYKAIKNIHSILKENGTYIMVECFLEPLREINKIRKNLNLDKIEIKFFNEYLTFNLFEEIKDYFDVQKKIDFLSLYYFISRIFNAYLSKGEPDYLSPINKLAVELTKKGTNPIQGFAPEIIFILKKRNKK